MCMRVYKHIVITRYKAAVCMHKKEIHWYYISHQDHYMKPDIHQLRNQ